MRIPSKHNAPSAFSSRQQKRVLLLLLLLTTVLIASRAAANPSNWNWLFRGQNKKNQTAPQKKQPLKTNEFHVTTPPKISPKNSPNNTILWGSIEDRTWNIRPEEAPTYFQLINQLTQTTPQQWQQQINQQPAEQKKNNTNPTFSVLMNSPQTYRGKLLTITGELHQLRRLPKSLLTKTAPAKTSTPKITLPQKTLYDAWIRTAESPQTPYRIILCERPPGINEFTEPKQFTPPLPIRVTGYFFKIQRYEVNKNREHFAPLIIAKSLKIQPVPEATTHTKTATPYVVGFIFSVIALFAFFVWRFSKNDKKFQQQHLQRIIEPTETERNALNNIPADTPTDLFSHLEKNNEPTTKPPTEQ